MGMPPAIEAGAVRIPVLSVSPIHEDHDALEQLLDRSVWRVHRALSLSSAGLLVQRTLPAVVVCEADLLPGTWREMLGHLNQIPRPPGLLVTSRLADDRLWAEALNLGAYDVLTKPFEPTEVVRSVHSAWLRWRAGAMQSASGS
jgi:DNA-binding response OmpR family regulator